MVELGSGIASSFSGMVLNAFRKRALHISIDTTLTYGHLMVSRFGMAIAHELN